MGRPWVRGMGARGRRAHCLGLAFGLGYALGRGMALAQDANTNNPYWVTTESGHHYLIDEDGVIQSGRFRGTPIGSVRQQWQKRNGEIICGAGTRADKRNGSAGRRVAGPRDFDNAIDRVLEEIKGKSRKQMAREAQGQSARQDYGRRISIAAGDNPIHALVLAREGHVRDAYQRPDIRGLGHIDLFWGNASAGLMHIIRRRLGDSNDRQEVKKVLKNLNDAIRHGRLRKDLSNDWSAVLQYNGIIAVVSLSYKGDGSRRAVITGYSDLSEMGKGR